MILALLHRYLHLFGIDHRLILKGAEDAPAGGISEARLGSLSPKDEVENFILSLKLTDIAPEL